MGYLSANHHTPLLGADPEVFIRDSNKRRYVSVHEHFHGTKKLPTPYNFGSTQIDGCALEFNIKPAATMFEFTRLIRAGVKILTTQVANVNASYELVFYPWVKFSKEIYDDIPSEYKILGCEPDFNGEKNGEINPTPRLKKGSYLRTAGGHIHIGWHNDDQMVEHPLSDQNHLNDCINMVRVIDHTVLVMSRLFDNDVVRFSMYGKPGAFRPKSYGVEYRSLSNVWVGDPKLTAWVYNAFIRASILSDYDQDPSEESVIRDVVEALIQPKGVVSKAQLLLAYEKLVTKYQMPELPLEYVNRAKK